VHTGQILNVGIFTHNNFATAITTHNGAKKHARMRAQLNIAKHCGVSANNRRWVNFHLT
jgi:hypothetical protein